MYIWVFLQLDSEPAAAGCAIVTHHITRQILCQQLSVSGRRPAHSAMVSLADFLLSQIPYRLPPHLYSYVKAQTPLSTDKSVVSALVAYLTVIFGIQAFQKNRPAQKLTTLFQAHNVFLSVGSALLLALMLEEILPIMWKHGLYYSLCSEHAWTPVCHLFLTSYVLCLTF